MDGFEIFNTYPWKPFTYLNIVHPFFFLNSHTIIYTWVVLVIIGALTLYARFALQSRKSVSYWCVSFIVRSFIDMTEQALGTASFNHIVFAASLFIFIFICNALSIIPWMGEPTADINTALGLGIYAFLYVQYYAIITHGILGYVKEFFSPLFIMFPLNLIGRFTSVISLSFRLFGNIFGSATILSIYQSFLQRSILFQIGGIGLNIVLLLFFGFAEAFIQAFVFAMLALSYLSIGIQGEIPEDID